MENHANIIENFKKLVFQTNQTLGYKILNEFYNREDLVNILEEKINIKQYKELRKPIIWEYDEYNHFKTFDEYKEFTEYHKPELIESLENIEGFLYRLEEIISYLENFGNKIEEMDININYKTIKNIENEVKKNKLPNECRKNNQEVYQKLHRLKNKIGENWYREITSHWDYKLREWTPELVAKEVKKYNSPSECEKNDLGLYVRLNKYRKELGEEWYKKIISEWEIRNTREWTLELVAKEVKKYNSPSECEKSNGGLYQALNKKFRIKLGEKWYEETTSHWKKLRKWTPELVAKEVQKYRSPKDCNSQDSGLYTKLCYYKKELGEKWYKKITSHWEYQLRKWTPELVAKEVKKYSYFTECERNDSGLASTLYLYRKELGEEWYNEVTSHWNSIINKREKEYINTIFIPRLSSLLESLEIEYELNQEVKIPKRDNDEGRVDVILKLINYDILMVIEIKHDESSWTNKQTQQQISKYNRAFRERKGFHGTYLVSPEGTYGFSEKEFFQIITDIKEKNELALPNSLDWHKKRRD